MQVALLEFLQSLAATRASRGKPSNKELAKLVGVSPPTLSRWLNGDENLTISTMCRLATALGAAVHIHVADNTKKGRWREEIPGKANARQSEKRQGVSKLPEVSRLTSDPGRSSVVHMAESRHTLRRVSQEEAITMGAEPVKDRSVARTRRERRKRV